MPDVLVIGGGVIGLGVAWRCAQRGLKVTVVDPAPGSGASSAAAGMLAPATELHYGEQALLQLNLDSARRYPQFAAELVAASGQDIGYRRSGALVAAWDDADLANLRDLQAFGSSLGVATELPPLLDTRAAELDLERADTAVFYSISNCQPGLAGVNLGTALVKQVVEALRLDLPQLRRFVTLSPIPGLRAWVEHALAADGAGLRTQERELLPAAPARVLARLSDHEWDVDEAIRPALLALCARYLTTAVEGRAADRQPQQSGQVRGNVVDLGRSRLCHRGS